jgi:hypothetical protein
MKFRIALIVVVAVSVVVCPLSFGGWGVGVTEAQVSFVPSIEPLEITRTVEGPRLGTVTPVPTLGPGQYFEEGDEDRLPEVARPELPDKPFGYSAILGHPGLALGWSTDDAGNKHYYVLEESSDFYERIQTIVYANREAARALEASDPLLRGIWAEIKAAGGALGGLFCGIAALATIEFPPLAAGLIGCSVAAFAAMGLSVDQAIAANAEMSAYLDRTEEDRLAIEGIFREIRYAPQP